MFFLIAAAVHPCFILNWLREKCKKDLVKRQLKCFVANSIASPLLEHPAVPLDDFLNFPPPTQVQPKNPVDEFLSNPSTSLDVLDQFPVIKDLFIKHNTPIPSSAPVERLFSQAALVLTVPRNSLRDDLLEILVLLKIHKKI